MQPNCPRLQLHPTRATTFGNECPTGARFGSASGRVSPHVGPFLPLSQGCHVTNWPNVVALITHRHSNTLKRMIRAEQQTNQDMLNSKDSAGQQAGAADRRIWLNEGASKISYNGDLAETNDTDGARPAEIESLVQRTGGDPQPGRTTDWEGTEGLGSAVTVPERPTVRPFLWRPIVRILRPQRL
jgi:hypothetical protein